MTQGKSALVDEADYDFLMRWKWFAHYCHFIWYALRRRRASEGDGPKKIAMQTALLIAKDGCRVDHIDGDGLNNRRSNLRVATRSVNQRNYHRRRPTQLGLPVGVAKSGKKFVAQIDSNRVKLGRFDTPAEAHAAYLVAREQRIAEELKESALAL